jgi:hypothetical protein
MTKKSHLIEKKFINKNDFIYIQIGQKEALTFP